MWVISKGYFDQLPPLLCHHHQSPIHLKCRTGMWTELKILANWQKFHQPHLKILINWSKLPTISVINTEHFEYQSKIEINRHKMCILCVPNLLACLQKGVTLCFVCHYQFKIHFLRWFPAIYLFISFRSLCSPYLFCSFLSRFPFNTLKWLVISLSLVFDFWFFVSEENE